MAKGTGQAGGAPDHHAVLSDDYFPNPDKYRLAAKNAGVSEMEFLETRIPPKNRSKAGASVVEVMMWHKKKVDLVGRGYSRSCAAEDIGDFTSDNFNKSVEAKLFWEWNEDSFCRTLQTGCSPSDLDNGRVNIDSRMPQKTTERLSSVSGLNEGSAENPYDEQPMMLTQQWEPQIDYRRIVASVDNTSRSVVRIPYNTTEEGEVNEMDVVPEGVAPLIVELGYSEETLRFTGYGATLRATDEYLLDNQTRAAAIREEVMKLALRRREALFHSLIREIYDNCPSSHFKKYSQLTASNWNEFRKVYENYQMRRMLGTPSAISEWEDVYFGVGGNRTVTMDFFARRGRGNNPGVLNNQPSIPDYGWVSREKNRFKDLAASEDLPGRTNEAQRYVMTFDERHTIKVWFRRGLQQDEMARDPETRKMSRHFHTDVGYYVPDANSIWLVGWDSHVVDPEPIELE